MKDTSDEYILEGAEFAAEMVQFKSVESATRELIRRYQEKMMSVEDVCQEMLTLADKLDRCAEEQSDAGTAYTLVECSEELKFQVRSLKGEK